MIRFREKQDSNGCRKGSIEKTERVQRRSERVDSRSTGLYSRWKRKQDENGELFEGMKTDRAGEGIER